MKSNIYEHQGDLDWIKTFKPTNEDELVLFTARANERLWVVDQLFWGCQKLPEGCKPEVEKFHRRFMFNISRERNDLLYRLGFDIGLIPRLKDGRTLPHGIIEAIQNNNHLSTLSIPDMRAWMIFHNLKITGFYHIDIERLRVFITGEDWVPVALTETEGEERQFKDEGEKDKGAETEEDKGEVKVVVREVVGDSQEGSDGEEEEEEEEGEERQPLQQEAQYLLQPQMEMSVVIREVVSDEEQVSVSDKKEEDPKQQEAKGAKGDTNVVVREVDSDGEEAAQGQDHEEEQEQQQE